MDHSARSIWINPRLGKWDPVKGITMNYTSYLEYLDNGIYPDPIKIDFNVLKKIWFNPETRADYKADNAKEIGYWFMQLERTRPDVAP